MNRNVESHFSQLPAAELQRSTFDRSSCYKTSFNVGDVIPFMVDEVLPGDSFDITTSKVVRSQTLLTPLMDNIYLDTYYFFVPNRLVWKHWKEFCGENTAGAWAPAAEYTIPKIASPAGGFTSGTIADYMGLPVNVAWSADDQLAPSALPFRAYALICNEFFRDENLSDPLLIPMDDANQTGVNTGNYIADVANGGKPFRAAKYHDYFTSALPAPQKGESVGVPITVPVFNGGTFPVSTGENLSHSQNFFPLVFDTGIPDTGKTVSSSGDKVASVPAIGNVVPYFMNRDGANLLHGAGSLAHQQWSGSYGALYPLNLQTVIPSSGSGDDTTVNFSVNELRLAFAYQRFLESLARSGSRYTELLLGLFGVRSPDARLQRPEYLGGNRIPINISEVTNNSQSEQDFLGDLGAKSQTTDVNHDFVKSFTEHGYLIGLMVARYDHSYSQGLQRFWTRSTFTDFYNPKFAHLGEVPIYKAEIFASSDTIADKSKVFGYQEIWADYRYKPSMVTGEMRPGVTNSLAYWNLADNYASEPTLSDEWIRESTANVDRALAVTSSVSNQFWADIYIRNKCTRCMPMYSVPGLIDHF
ncbi:MAG: major capsid protein [Microviridae sp.]|nr:MAG: major capsid protein [Microviridae sp.]